MLLPATALRCAPAGAAALSGCQPACRRVKASSSAKAPGAAGSAGTAVGTADQLSLAPDDSADDSSDDSPPAILPALPCPHFSLPDAGGWQEGPGPEALALCQTHQPAGAAPSLAGLVRQLETVDSPHAA